MPIIPSLGRPVKEASHFGIRGHPGLHETFVKMKKDWRNGSVVKNTSCFFTEPKFSSQHPWGDSQLSPVLTSASTAHVVYMQTYRQNTNTYKI